MTRGEVPKVGFAAEVEEKLQEHAAHSGHEFGGAYARGSALAAGDPDGMNATGGQPDLVAEIFEDLQSGVWNEGDGSRNYRLEGKKIFLDLYESDDPVMDGDLPVPDKIYELQIALIPEKQQ